jgi:hypothetical protein
MESKMAEKDKLPNIRALRGFKGPDGKHVAVGDILPKAAFAAGDWQTLTNMTPPRAEETDDEPSGKTKKSALPGA